MKHLCYIYIANYQCLRGVEIIIDPRYIYKFDRTGRTVDITDSEIIPADFWPENVYSLTGIVGNNGAGKSTVMRFLLDSLVTGSAHKSTEDIFIYEDSGTLYYYGDNVEILYKGNKLAQISDSLKDLNVFYYSGHFSPTYMESPLNSELAGSYIASDNVRLIKDLQDYYNLDSIHMTLPLNRYLYSHIARNNYRICSMLADCKLSNIVKDFVWPQYVGISINMSGYVAMNKRIDDDQKLSDKLGIPWADVKIPKDVLSDKITCAKERFLSKMLYYNLLNITYDLWGGWRLGFDIINQWQAYERKGSVMQQFEMFIETIDSQEKKIHLINLYEFFSSLLNLTNYGTDSLGNEFLYIDCKDDADKLIEFGDKILKNDFYLTSKFCDIYYLQSIDGTPTTLSSGEQELLNLFSRLYEAIIVRPPKLGNIDIPSLLLLDEAEIGFHPEWQRSFIDLLLKFIGSLKECNIRNDFQILISTHSPILLSDIPKCCTNYLRRNMKGEIERTEIEVESETFAANVFNLYRMSFFMENGLVGKFAANKIEEFSKRIDIGEKHGVWESIQLVGDERIREFLIYKYQQQFSQEEDLIKYHKSCIEQLQKKKRNE